MAKDELLSRVDSLPIDLRIKLLEKILKSLNPVSQEVDELWSEEAENRVKEIRDGKVDTIPGEKVFDEILRSYSK